MGTLLAASLQGRQCYRGVIHESPHSDSKLCRVLAGLFLCTFGLAAYYVTKPETYWLRFARVLTLTGTSALMILTPFQMIKTASEKLVLSVTSSIKKSKNQLTMCLEVVTIMESVKCS